MIKANIIPILIATFFVCLIAFATITTSPVSNRPETVANTMPAAGVNQVTNEDSVFVPKTANAATLQNVSDDSADNDPAMQVIIPEELRNVDDGGSMEHLPEDSENNFHNRTLQDYGDDGGEEEDD